MNSTSESEVVRVRQSHSYSMRLSQCQPESVSFGPGQSESFTQPVRVNQNKPESKVPEGSLKRALEGRGFHKHTARFSTEVANSERVPPPGQKNPTAPTKTISANKKKTAALLPHFLALFLHLEHYLHICLALFSFF